MMRWLFLVILALAIVAPPVFAQDQNLEVDNPATGVYVTTQDFSALREGPGQAFSRVDVVPPATTLPAIGRTTDAGWIQVRYGEKSGWIAAWLLVWSGDMVSLPADGINPVSFVRRRGPTITVSSEMLIYDQQLNGPGVPVNFPADTARVEITARLGSGDNFWLQFWYVNRYYWIGAWNLHLKVPGVFFNSVPDADYRYPFGRLLVKMYAAFDASYRTYSTIQQLWNSLAAGQSVSCYYNPAPITDADFPEADLNLEPIFVPTARLLQTAVAQTNSAISRLADACAQVGADRLLTTDIVDDALNDLAEAGRNFDLLIILLPPVANRDPAVGHAG